MPRLQSGERPFTIEDLLAREQIKDVIYRYCRALDRNDRDLALSCYHSDGTDDHGRMYSGSATGFIDWVWPVHADMLSTRHMISNILIEQHDADHAAAESYAHLILRVRNAGKVYDCYFYSRYVDRFDRVDGIWRIRHRTQVRDFQRYEEVIEGYDALPGNAVPFTPNNPEATPAVAARDETDPSFAVLHAR